MHIIFCYILGLLIVFESFRVYSRHGLMLLVLNALVVYITQILKSCGFFKAFCFIFVVIVIVIDVVVVAAVVVIVAVVLMFCIERKGYMRS